MVFQDLSYFAESHLEDKIYNIKPEEYRQVVLTVSCISKSGNISFSNSSTFIQLFIYIFNQSDFQITCFFSIFSKKFAVDKRHLKYW